MPATCRGAGRAIRIECGSARSCCSRRRWRPSFRTTSVFWPNSRTSNRWLRPTKKTCCGCGRGSVTIAARGSFTGPHRLSPHNTKAAFPDDAGDVRALPGIGRYTAGAVLSIAFDQQQPIVEANTSRVLSRLLAFRGDPAGSEGQNLLWRFAEELLPRKHVGAFNQALMELGSQICSPRNPACHECPVARCCATRQRGWQEQIPAPKKRTAYEDVRQGCVVVWRDDKRHVLLRRCGDDERWAGLWDFPRFDLKARRGPALRAELVSKVARMTGMSVQLGDRLTTIKHGVTRFRITLCCYDAVHLQGNIDNGDLRWIRTTELSNYPLNVTGRKISNRLTAQVPLRTGEPNSPVTQ